MRDEFVRLDPAARDRIRELQIPGEADLYLKLTELFIDESERLMSQLRENLGSARAGALRDLAHKWKNNALAIGALRLGKLCQDLEAAALATSSGPSAPDIVSAIGSEFRAVATLLKPGAKPNL